VQFFSNASEYELLEEDDVVLNCYVRLYGNLRPNVTVEVSDGQSGRLTFEEYFPATDLAAVQYNVSVTWSMSGPFYCTVTAVTVENVSKTLDLHLSRITGELFQRVVHVYCKDVSRVKASLMQ